MATDCKSRVLERGPEFTESRVAKAFDERVTANGGAYDLLTRRELEVLKCIADGHSTKEVAGMLGMSFKTAACHRYRLMNKLNIHDTASLVRYAIRNDIIMP